MEFTIKSGDPLKTKTSCIVIPITNKNNLSHLALEIDKQIGGLITKVIKHGDFSGEKGETLFLYGVENILAERILLLGCGDKELNLPNIRDILEKAFSALQKAKLTSAIFALAEIHKQTSISPNELLSQAILAREKIFYQFLECKSQEEQKKAQKKLISCTWFVENKTTSLNNILQYALSTTKGIATAKDLANSPANYCTPTFMAKRAKELAKEYKSITCKILDKEELVRLKMGAFLAVTAGSSEPPKLIVLNYQGKEKSDSPIALVGKGITFDTGGLSLKPSANMMGMKFDMSGAASVMGTIQAIADMQLPINVVGLLACAENMPNGNATRPDDVVTSMSGKTIEISNTDAEGRLVLCDTLTYASKQYKPKAIIDIATLTGACVVALGAHASGLYSNKQDLAACILAAGEKSLDRAWQMPLWEEYQSQLDSKVADVCNIGGPSAGSVTAACFLSRFVDDNTPWAHLDIAGTAATSMGQGGLATGRPVALLVQYLFDQSKS